MCAMTAVKGTSSPLGTRAGRYSMLQPLQEGERIFEKCYNSAFKDTGLEEYLKEKKITDIILGGLQTEYCIDATCKSAFERGLSRMDSCPYPLRPLIMIILRQSSLRSILRKKCGMGDMRM